MQDFLHNLAGAAFLALALAALLHSVFGVSPFGFALYVSVLGLVGVTVLCLMIKGAIDWMRF
jgi:hypothetical protein